MSASLSAWAVGLALWPAAASPRGAVQALAPTLLAAAADAEADAEADPEPEPAPADGRPQSGATPAVPASVGKMPAPPAATEPAPAADSPPSPESVQAAQRAFAAALAAYHADRFGAAAEGFHAFLRRPPTDGDNVAWAQFFLGSSLEHLELPGAAAIYYFLVAKSRTQPEIIGEALARLEALGRAGPVDEEMVGTDLLEGGDFGFLPADLKSWVAYNQGRSDLVHRDAEWAERRFQTIDPRSPYAADAQIVRAVAMVREHRDSEALELLRGVLAGQAATPRARNQAQLTTARLLFDRGRYAEALAAYDRVTVQDLSFEEAEVLAEKAWATYYLGDAPRTLGLLHALGAPSYERYFLPETYLLKALVYKDLCHYLAAKNAVRAFRIRYGAAAAQISQRAPLVEVERVRRAAATEGVLARRTQLLLALEDEARRVGRIGDSSPVGLRAHLQIVYRDAIATHARRWRRAFGPAAARVAGRLLDTVEQMHLLDYETSLAIYAPRDASQEEIRGGATPLALPDATTHDWYAFDGEYWNEELSRYRVTIGDRCQGTP